MTILQRRSLIMAAAGLLAAPALARAGVLMPVKPLEMDWAYPFYSGDDDPSQHTWARVSHDEFSHLKALYNGVMKGDLGVRVMESFKPWDQKVHGPQEIHIYFLQARPKTFTIGAKGDGTRPYLDYIDQSKRRSRLIT